MLYDRLLQERLQDIEQVINDYFDIVRQIILEEKLEKRERDLEKAKLKE